MEKDKGLSILSAFLLAKVKGKDWSKKDFAREAGLSVSYAYELLSGKRDAIPSDEILDKVCQALALADGENKYVLALGECERKAGRVIYISDEVDVPELLEEDLESDEIVPYEPGEPLPTDEPGEPESEEPVTPDEPIEPLVPEPEPVTDQDAIRAGFRETFKEFMEERKLEQMGSLEEQATYRLGRLEGMIEHLKDEKQLLLKELDKYKELSSELSEDEEELRKQLESLPDEPEVIIERLKENRENISLLQKEREVIRELREKSEAEKDEIEKEKEEAVKELEEAKEREEKLKEKLKELERVNKFLDKQLKEEWKPWWEKLFSGLL